MEGRTVVAIDDADLYGYQLSSLLRDVVPSRDGVLFIIAMRSSKIDVIADPLARTQEVRLIEHVVPPLSDDDVDNLIAVLDRHHRLGVLKGKSQEERRRAFSDKCGRQLLVAMIEATSGQRFEDKAAKEFDDLEGLPRFVYAVLCVATTQRHFLTRDEILLACAGVDGDPLDALRKLLTRHLVVAPPPTNQHRARHRVIADIVFEKLVDAGQAATVVSSLAYALASKAARERRDRVWRLLVRLINHKFLITTMDLQSARNVYQQVESLLSDDYHFWLQRGSLEVEHGELRRAEQFLNQARSLAVYDYRVDTEYAYLLFRKGIDAPTDVHAAKWIEQATQLLEGVVATRGDQDSYPFHVIGSQGLAWSRRRGVSKEERRRLLAYYLHVVEQGIKKHPNARDLKKLHADLQQDYLTTAVPTR